jgi:hypothetical protein
MPQETETAIQTAIVEDVSEEFNEQVNSSTWLSGDELDLLDMSTPLGTWDDIEL